MEATNAFLMRAVCAALAARLGRALLFLPVVAGWLLFFLLVAEGPLGFADELDEPEEVWPAIGVTANSDANAAARHRASPGARVEKFATLMSPL